MEVRVIVKNSEGRLIGFTFLGYVSGDFYIFQ